MLLMEQFEVPLFCKMNGIDMLCMDISFEDGGLTGNIIDWKPFVMMLKKLKKVLVRFR